MAGCLGSILSLIIDEIILAFFDVLFRPKKRSGRDERSE